MSATIPDWYVFVLLGLASFRIWRLLAVDTILDSTRKRLFRWADYEAGDTERYRYRLDEFVACPWCFGFWITAIWGGLWGLWPDGIEPVSAVLALSAVVGFLAKADS